MAERRAGPRPAPDPDRRAYFGDLHVHTTYSFDAFVFGTLASPHEAYRFARGEAIAHPAGFDVQLRQPLDFYAVTDHAEFLGVAAAAGDTTTAFSTRAVASALNDLNPTDDTSVLSLNSRFRMLSTFLPRLAAALDEGTVERAEVDAIMGTAWRDTIDAAERYNDPGHFTTFVGFEYTASSDEGGNLHRNVIFRDGDGVPDRPFSRYESRNPEDLWVWMDGLRARGVESLAIPHNSNASNGHMFERVDWAGQPLDAASAEQRIRNEPLVEITQVKGTSETHPSLSTRDEWADFEIMPYLVNDLRPSEPAGSYVRDALRRGLTLEQRGGVNPYALGFVGSSDTHVAATSVDEADYFAMGLFDGTPELRGTAPLSFFAATVLGLFGSVAEVGDETFVQSATPTYGASGLAGVWAEENTREALYAALRRRETFATSGPRIQLRLFGGYDFQDNIVDAPDLVARADAGGVTMGGELPPPPEEARPGLLLWALADPGGAPLQRLQVVKGWADEAGETHEQVYDVACSGGDPVDPDTHRCPDNGSRVDLADCSLIDGSGTAALRTLWRDPAFDPTQPAFYYARVLENPTCRWSTWDALRAARPPRPDLPLTVQERAWSSPIWFRPAATESATRP